MKIHPSLVEFEIEVDLLVPLPGNPRVGNVNAIMASYSEFGQVKPIVIKDNGDGSFTVIAGNHQLEAARRLGWQKIAAVKLDADDSRAIAFALADNRTMELGHTEPDLLNEMISQVTDFYPELMEDLGWDDFEMAAISEQVKRLSASDILSEGYVPPQIINPFMPEFDDEGIEQKAERQNMSVDAASRGAAAAGVSSGAKAVVQYTLMFDDADQQRHWYDFIRYLKNSTVYEGDTTAQRLMMFIDAHTEI
jgi:hypothetical protein